MSEPKFIRGCLDVGNMRHYLSIHVKHSPGDLISSITIGSNQPFAPISVGERVIIGDLEGFPEARHTWGKVRKVGHRLTGGSFNFTHTVNVYIDELADNE